MRHSLVMPEKSTHKKVNMSRRTALQRGACLFGSSVLGISFSSGKVTADSTEITDCTTIDEPGQYVLPDDISGTGDCLSIRSSDVTIDGQGHTLSGDGTGWGIATGFDGIEIRNLTVTNFEHGIHNWNSSGSEITLEDSTVTKNQIGIELYRIAELNVYNSTITDNGTGITDTEGSQILVDQSTLRRNNAAVSTSYGNTVELKKSSVIDNGEGIRTGQGVFKENTIERNGGDGISLMGFPQGAALGSATIVGNKIQANNDAGIKFGYCNGEVRENTISNNQNGIISYTGGLGGSPDQYVFSKNNIADNDEFGIQHQGWQPVAIATCNYWGHATGPRHANNPRNNPKGAKISDNVTFIPWSVTRIRDGKGTCPNTGPRKDLNQWGNHHFD